MGEAKAGGQVNLAPGTFALRAGETVQVTLKMDLGFESEFTVKAFAPVTLSTYDKLDLETDYTVWPMAAPARIVAA